MASRRDRASPRMLRNRRDGSMRWVSLIDLWENLRDRWYVWSRRIPSGSLLKRDRKGEYDGYIRRVDW